MFCPKCGKETDTSGKFCQWCGADVGTPVPPRAVVRVEETEEEGEPTVGDYAGLGRRFFAFIIDLLLLLVITTIAAAFFNLVQGIKYFYYLVFQHAPIAELTIEGTKEAAYFPILAAFGVILVIIPWIYFAGFEASRAMATPGKTAMHIVVADKNGNRITFARATIRHFAKYISTLIIFIGFIMIGLTKKRQGLHDKAAECLVLLPTE